MSKYAPIALFVFNRPDCTTKTLESLARNELASESDLIIYADASKIEEQIDTVREVRRIAKSASGFKSVTVIERERNIGLAKNISDGVSEVIAKFGQIIVLEDDVVTSPYFLKFMNEALKRYKSDSKVWHVSGWNYPIDTDGLAPAYFWRIMNCWGWATWGDRWKFYKKIPTEIVNAWSLRQRQRFDIDGCIPFFSQIIANYIGERNTWAIFWYATIFEHEGLCLTPAVSLTANIGGDGSGTHVDGPNIFFKSICQDRSCASYDQFSGILNFPVHVEESREAIRRIKILYKLINSTNDKVKRFIYYYIPTSVWVALKKIARVKTS